jgi:ornithine cyclodeaminase
MTILLSEHDVKQLIDMPALIGIMETALKALSAGEVEQPVRGVVMIPPQQAFMAAMPAYLQNPPALGTKLVTVFPNNHAYNLPSHLAIIVYADPSTGEVLAIMDARLITEMRTAAVSAVSVKYMAREDAKVLAILGAGAQAESHFEAIAYVRQLEKVVIWNRTPARAEGFRAKFSGHGLPIEIAPTVQVAVKDADIIATVTGTTEPILQRDWLKAGVHICAVGSARPTMREIDTATMQAAHIIVDKREAALKEAGDILIPLNDEAITADAIRGELGEVVAGKAIGRPSPDAITLFESLGQAVEDVATAEWVYRQAAEKGMGVTFSFQ